MRCCAVTGLHWRCCYAAALLKSFDVARQVERLELPEVRALGPPKHRQQVSTVIITGLLDHPQTHVDHPHRYGCEFGNSVGKFPEIYSNLFGNFWKNFLPVPISCFPVQQCKQML